MDKIRFEKKVFISGTSSVITLPEEVQKFLGVQNGDIIVMQPESGKHGKYLALWKKVEETEEHTE